MEGQRVEGPIRSRVRGEMGGRCRVSSSSSSRTVKAWVCAFVRPDVVLLDIALCCVGKFLLMLA